MGQLLPHRHPRGLRRRGPLTLWLLGLALAGEIALVELGPGQVLMVDGVVIDGAEARGLPGGAHQVHVTEGQGRLIFRRRVLLREDERVELDPGNRMAPEVYRGPIPERTPDDRTKEPQLLVVGAVDWRNLRLHLDGAPLPLDPATRTFRKVLPPGPHRLERLVAGRPRPPVTLEVVGAPWQCAVARDGSMDCVELAEPPSTPVDAVATTEALRKMPPQDRLSYMLSLDASVSCIDVARWMDLLYGDEEKLALALAIRAKVNDPWNHVVLERALSFPESRRRVQALYGGREPPPVVEQATAPTPRPKPLPSADGE